MRIAMAQINPTVGDLEGNVEKIRCYICKSKERKANLAAFPELAVTGYTPQRLTSRRKFHTGKQKTLERIIKESKKLLTIVVFADYDPSRKGSDGTEMKYTAATVIQNGKLVGVQYKTLLSTCDVFDEDRYFTPAVKRKVFNVNDVKAGVEIYEDLWYEGLRS